MAIWECKTLSDWVGNGTRNNPYRPLFKGEYPGCTFSVLSSTAPPGGECDLHVTMIPDDATATAIDADPRFEDREWAEVE